MATRFYFESTIVAAVNPAFGAGWDSAQGERRRLNATKQASAMATETRNASAAGTHVLCTQFVSDALAAQTIAGTVRGQMRVLQNNLLSNGYLFFRLAKCNNNGSVVTEIIALSGTVDAGSGYEMAGTLVNRPFTDSIESATVSVPSPSIDDGDRLIVEVGLQEGTSNTGRTFDFRIGDADAADLAVDLTDTDDNNPWFEFSQTLVFQSVDGAIPVPFRFRGQAVKRAAYF